MAIERIRIMAENASRDVAQLLGTSVEEIDVDYKENDAEELSSLLAIEQPDAYYRINKDGYEKVFVERGVKYLPLLHEVFHCYHSRKNPHVRRFNQSLYKLDGELHEISTLLSTQDLEKLSDIQGIERKYFELLPVFVRNLIIHNLGIERIAHAGTTLLTTHRPYKRFLYETLDSKLSIDVLQRLIDILNAPVAIPNPDEIQSGIKEFGNIENYLKRLVKDSYYIGICEGIKAASDISLIPKIKLRKKQTLDKTKFLASLEYTPLSPEQARSMFLELFYQDPLVLTQRTLEEHHKENERIAEFLESKLKTKEAKHNGNS